MISYISDPFRGRGDLFAYKTAYFLKRNWSHYSHSISHTCSHIWDELKKVGLGFKMLNEDFKFFIRF